MIELGRVEVLPRHKRLVWVVAFGIPSHKHVYDFWSEIALSDKTIGVYACMYAVDRIARLLAHIVHYSAWSSVCLLRFVGLELVCFSCRNIFEQLPCV